MNLTVKDAKIVNNKERANYIAGLVTAFSAMSLYQDYLGLERYINIVKASWTSPYITVPIALIGLGIASLLAASKQAQTITITLTASTEPAPVSDHQSPPELQ